MRKDQRFEVESVEQEGALVSFRLLSWFEVPELTCLRVPAVTILETPALICLVIPIFTIFDVVPAFASQESPTFTNFECLVPLSLCYIEYR